MLGDRVLLVFSALTELVLLAEGFAIHGASNMKLLLCSEMDGRPKVTEVFESDPHSAAISDNILPFSWHRGFSDSTLL